MQPMYDPEAVKPMEDELAGVGVKPLRTAEEVDAFLQQEGTALVVVNSVCGCAAGSARPGVTSALQNQTIPNHSATVFAGMDREAVQRARDRMEGVMPSSPKAIALFKDGQLVFMMERQHIEQMDVNAVRHHLVNAFNEHCSAEGPSVPPDVYESVYSPSQCGSSIPIYGQS